MLLLSPVKRQAQFHDLVPVELVELVVLIELVEPVAVLVLIGLVAMA